MEVLCKDIIRTWILPHLSAGARGPDPTVDLLEVVECILYKLKTGFQWRLLPLKQFFTDQALAWSGGYDHFNEWRKDGSWKKLWVTFLRLHESRLDLSSRPLDGSHARAHNGGAAIGYQGRKAARTANPLFLTDNQGQPLACASPQAGNYRDLFSIEALLNELCDLVQGAQTAPEDLFMNADSGCAARALREACFRRDIEANTAHGPRSAPSEAAADHYLGTELYRQRTAIARTNAWLDSLKPCSCAVKRTWGTGEPSIFWPLPSCYPVGYPQTKNPKQAHTNSNLLSMFYPPIFGDAKTVCVLDLRRAGDLV